MHELTVNCTNTDIHCQNKNFSQARYSDFNTMAGLGEILALSLQILIALFGVTGNVLVISVITRTGKRKQPGDVYLLNLAIADLGTLVLTFPISVIREKLPINWPFGEFMCLYGHPVMEIFYGASVWCITVVAIDRYQKIVATRNLSRINNTVRLRTAKIVAACSWVISFTVFCLPLYFVTKYQEEPEMKIAACNPVMSPTFKGIYISFLTFFSYILPLIVISFTYIAISRVVNQSSVFIKLMKQGDTKDEQSNCLSKVKSIRLKQNKRAKKILTPLILTFAVTMLPLNILRLTWVLFKSTLVEQHFRKLFYAVTTFVLINSSANPVIYSVVSKDFRAMLANLCSTTRRGRPFSFRLPLIRASEKRTSAV